MISLLPLCSVPKVAIRDGFTGAFARLWLPFYALGSGEWFAGGQIYSFPTGTVPQQPGLTEQTTNQQNSFVKAAGVCL